MSKIVYRRYIGIIIFIVVFTVSFLFRNSATVVALSGSDFRAGKIIDDTVHYNGSAMSSAEIQNFLNAKLPNCDTNGAQPSNQAGYSTRADWGRANGYSPPYTCLKDYIESTPSKAADSYCNAYTGGTKTAAQIIKDVGSACNISQKSLIVLLQKEQSLVTDDWPWSIQYRSATGYGCPDTAACDSTYYGFFNQVYNASRQFKRYAIQSQLFNYRAGQTSYIQYNPNAGCGGSNVYIENAATAALYNYTPYQPNASALNNLYGSGDACGAYGNRNFWRMMNDWFGSTYFQQTILATKSHVSNSGWSTSFTINSGITGTTGLNRSMEAFKIHGDVEYTSYNVTTGWQPLVSKGMISGTTGQNKPIQAIKIRPIGVNENLYDIYYRAHVSDIGWMDWAKNGAVAGATGDNTKNIEAFEIKLVLKNSTAPGVTTTPYQNLGLTTYEPSLSLSIRSHVANIGWQPVVTENMTSGTTEQARSIEATTVTLVNNTGLEGSIVHSAHVAGIGWQAIKNSSETAGTTGQSRQIEAYRLSLTGELTNNYDIWYRAHVATKGWTGWAKNGSPTGSVGSGLGLEAIETRLTTKDAVSLPQQNNFINPKQFAAPDNYSINYSAHVSNVGWLYNIGQNNVGGTTGQAKPLEALQFTNSNSFQGTVSIDCSVFVKNTGWTTNVSPGNLCGTTGQAKPLEAIRLNISSSISSNYDVYYRTHLSQLGWQSWVKNNETSGIPSSGKSIEAIMVKFVQK